MQNNTYDIALQKATSEFQLNNFFKHYPLEHAQENIAKLFDHITPYPLEVDTINPMLLFYEELKLLLKNCELIYAHRNQHLYSNQRITTIIHFLKEVIPSAYIFYNPASTNQTDLIVVMDKCKYKPFDEISTLLDFAMLGYENINCTVYTYGTIHEFLSKGHLYFSSLCTSQNCLYQNSHDFTLPLLDPQKKNELIEKSTQLFNKNMQKAITFYSGVHKFINECDHTISAFMLQQACELTYRSLLLALRGKQIKCHDLVVLRKHLSHFAPSIIGIINEDECKEIALLTLIQEAYIKSRYDQHYQVSLNELMEAIAATDRLIKRAQKIFNYHCQKIKLL